MKPIVDILIWLLATPGLIVTNVIYFAACLLVTVHRWYCLLLCMIRGTILFDDYSLEEAMNYIGNSPMVGVIENVTDMFFGDHEDEEE